MERWCTARHGLYLGFSLIDHLVQYPDKRTLRRCVGLLNRAKCFFCFIVGNDDTGVSIGGNSGFRIHVRGFLDCVLESTRASRGEKTQQKTSIRENAGLEAQQSTQQNEPRGERTSLSTERTVHKRLGVKSPNVAKAKRKQWRASKGWKYARY